METVIVGMEGVVRDSMNAFHHAYEYALSSAGVRRLDATPAETWKLRGYAEFSTQRAALKAIYAVAKANENMTRVFWKKDPVGYVNEIVKDHQPTKEILDKIERAYLGYLTAPRVLRRIPPVRAGKMGVRLLKESGRNVGVLTNSPKDFNDKWVALKKMNDHFHTIVSTNDVGASTPDPDGITKLCLMMKTKPQRTIYVGDTEAGLRAAKKAECIPIAVVSGRSDRKALKESGATYVFGDLTEFALWLRKRGKFK